ncbi:zinc protease [Lentilactobacillus kosonis]|uniref:Zinc protease n=1 Tax=Lentilactobacillus kosonis TaxID=2810561 RepID=A0A401FNG7_9LACO|nr:zinc protease [Lentilactobacillus kosonis]
MINHPLVENNQFESNFFDLHKANLLNYLNSIIEDREYYANIQLQKLMFPNDANHGSFLYGTAEQLEALDSSTIYQFYQWLLTNANIMAFIGGNTSDELVDQLSNILPKANHKFEQLKPFVKLPQSNQVFRDEKILDIEQTILTMGYELPVYSGDQLYYPAVILNQLLGGSPQSILFTDVREKQSLAYDISSSYNSLNGSLTVSAGILPQNQALVENLVAESIHKIMGGQIDQQVIAGIKQSLIDQRNQVLIHLVLKLVSYLFMKLLGLMLMMPVILLELMRLASTKSSN